MCWILENDYRNRRCCNRCFVHGRTLKSRFLFTLFILPFFTASLPLVTFNDMFNAVDKTFYGKHVKNVAKIWIIFNMLFRRPLKP